MQHFALFFIKRKIATVNRKKDFQTSYPPKNAGIRGIFVSKVTANEKRGGLKVVAFDRFPFMLVLLRFSKKSMQAPSCRRPKTAHRTLLMSFAFNNCLQISA